MRKKQRTVAIVIAGLVSLSMIASPFVLYFYNPNTTTPTSTAANTVDVQVNDLQTQVKALEQAVKANPQDINLKLNLANTYYDLAMAQLNSSSPDQAGANFKQAVATYQEVAKSKKDDVNILVDMATAAFYGGDNTLAETTFKQALALKPDFFNALLNYGYFLMEAKQDYLGAIAEWNKAINTNPSPDDVNRAKSLISMAQAKLNESAGKSNTSSSGSGVTNPVLSGAKPATPGGTNSSASGSK